MFIPAQAVGDHRQEGAARQTALPLASASIKVTSSVLFWFPGWGWRLSAPISLSLVLRHPICLALGLSLWAPSSFAFDFTFRLREEVVS